MSAYRCTTLCAPPTAPELRPPASTASAASTAPALPAPVTTTSPAPATTSPPATGVGVGVPDPHLFRQADVVSAAHVGSAVTGASLDSEPPAPAVTASSTPLSESAATAPPIPALSCPATGKRRHSRPPPTRKRPRRARAAPRASYTLDPATLRHWMSLGFEVLCRMIRRDRVNLEDIHFDADAFTALVAGRTRLPPTFPRPRRLFPRRASRGRYGASSRSVATPPSSARSGISPPPCGACPRTRTR